MTNRLALEFSSGVVEDEQLAVMGVVRRVVAAKAERVLGVQPPGSGVEAICGAADVDD